MTTTVNPFAAMVEHLAALLAYAQRRKGSQTVHLSAFDKAQPYTSHYVRVTKDIGQDEDLGMLPTDAKPSDLDGPIDNCVVGDSHAHEDANRVRAYFPMAVRPATWADYKGQRLPFVSKHHCRLVFGLLHYDGTYEIADRLMSFHPREREWMVWGPGLIVHRQQELSRRMRILLGSQFVRRYEWHALIGIGNGPRVSLPCTAKQAQKLFRARELPRGEPRRAALLHWVAEHYRAKESESPIHVRPHFRGIDEFTWQHMHCSIEPSRYDADQVAAQAAEPRPSPLVATSELAHDVASD